jgi:hypothetical protein
MKALQELANQLKQLGVKECTIKLNYKDHIALSIKNYKEMNEKGIDAVMTPVGSQEKENSSFVINGKPERMSYYIVDGIIINYYSDEIKTIPITEELLLKFGFELFYLDTPHQYGYQKNSIKVVCDKSKGLNEISVIDSPHIKYVHQLQTLYFALTGEELIHDEWVVTKDNHPSIVNILKD